MAVSDAYEPPANGFRTFVIIWLTQAISAFGSQLTFFALTIWLTQTLYPRPEQKPELAFALSAMSLIFGLSIFLAPIAGAWADRHDRKRTMMVCDFINGCMSVLLFSLILSGTLQLWMVLVVIPVFSIVGLYHNFAFDTSYAMIVPEKQLPRANGMMQTMWAVSGILSPAIAATIIALPDLARQGILPGGVSDVLRGMRDGSALPIIIDAVTFFIASAVLIFLYVPSPKRTDLQAGAGAPRKSMWADIREGARYIVLRKPLIWLLATFTIINFAMAPLEVFIPLLLKFNLASDWQTNGMTFNSALAFISTAGAIGGVIGGFIMSTWGGVKRRKVYAVVISIMISGAVQIMYGLSPFIYLSAASNFLIAALLPVMNSHSQAIWQTQVPRHLQGRVFSVRRMIAQFTVPLGVMLAGLTGASLNPGVVLAVLGGLVVVFTIFQLFNPYLLNVENKEFLDNLAGVPATAAAAPVEATADLNNATAQPSEGDVSLGSPTSVPAMPTPNSDFGAGETGFASSGGGGR